MTVEERAAFVAAELALYSGDIPRRYAEEIEAAIAAAIREAETAAAAKERERVAKVLDSLARDYVHDPCPYRNAAIAIRALE